NRPLIYKVTADRLPDFWKGRLNKERIKGETSKLARIALEEKKKEVMGDWIEEGKIAKGHIIQGEKNGRK
ncbi:unnamed protein product, partial [marine sediment metagenome]